jgi:hypothetical protein
MKSLLSLAVVTAMFATAANAQTISSTLWADIPFEFMAGTNKLPAGTYNIDSPYPNVVRLQSTDRKASAMLIAHGTSSAAQREGRLLFNKYGNQHFLANVQGPGTNVGLGLRPSAAEREMSAQSARPSTQVVTARRR